MQLRSNAAVGLQSMRHGVPLILFWTMTLAIDTLELVNFNSPLWPFLLTKSLSHVQ